MPIIALGIVLLAVAGGWLAMEVLQTKQPPPPPKAPRPATINNVVLRIESNIIRTHNIMEDLVFTTNATDLGSDAKAIERLHETMSADFEAMGGGFSADNEQYKNALALFRAWNKTRQEVIQLIAKGEYYQARQIVRNKCTEQTQEIRQALAALNEFSRQRMEEFEAGGPGESRDGRRDK